MEIHNYVASTSANTKLSNWNTLNSNSQVHFLEKVLKKINNFQISKNDIEHIITCTPDTIERVLKVTQNKIRGFIEKKKNQDTEVKSEQNKEAEYKKVSQNQDFKDVIMEKDTTIKELKSTVEILELKIDKMQKLIQIKDSKIQSLVAKLQQAGIAWSQF